MDLTLSTCFVIVHDPDQALAFYRDTLGLELRNYVANEGFRWVTVGAAAQPGVGIVLTNYLNGSPADGDAVTALVAKGALNGVHFHTDDLDDTFEKVRDSGAEIVQEPTEQFWGTRDFAVRDPSGNLVRIDQPPAALSARGRRRSLPRWPERHRTPAPLGSRRDSCLADRGDCADGRLPVELVTANSQVVRALVADGRADVGVAASRPNHTPNPGVRGTGLVDDAIVWAVPSP